MAQDRNMGVSSRRDWRMKSSAVDVSTNTCVDRSSAWNMEQSVEKDVDNREDKIDKWLYSHLNLISSEWYDFCVAASNVVQSLGQKAIERDEMTPVRLAAHDQQ